MTKKKTEKEKPKYRVDIVWSTEDDCYIANVPELPNCQTHGATMEDAVAMAKEAIEGYLETLEKEKLPIPPPLSERKFSGKIPLRIDPTLHRDLAVRATIEGLSVNRYIEQRLKKAG